ncbi:MULTISPECIES: hypothetical protein [unclassified Methylobacterium]|uniref:hypothetical protein n=1 Tax=unclassified Methylobacterium TaxID=2615210 RepID=UPI000B16F862|nr:MULTISPECIES: hypothetical protein [unclassified Methylobacterium]
MRLGIANAAACGVITLPRGMVSPFEIQSCVCPVASSIAEDVGSDRSIEIILPDTGSFDVREMQSDLFVFGA